MKQWFISKFRKKVAVRVFILTTDKRLLHYWIVPKGATVTINNLTYRLTTDDFMLRNNVPTYFFNENDPAPIVMTTGQVHELSAHDFNVAMEAHIARDIFDAAGGFLLSPETIITLATIVLSALALGFFLNEKLTTIISMLQSLGI